MHSKPQILTKFSIYRAEKNVSYDIEQGLLEYTEWGPLQREKPMRGQRTKNNK